MKKVILAAFLCLAWVLPASAMGPYVGVSGGLSVVHDSDLDVAGFGTFDVEYDPGYGFNLAAGYNFDPVRLEAEFGYKKADVDEISFGGVSEGVDDVDITTMSFMANGYYDFKASPQLTPFIGAGIGVINGEINDDEFGDTDDTVFGYQLTAGITTPINRNVNFDVYYRFLGAATDFEDGDEELSYHSSSFFAGVRVNF